MIDCRHLVDPDELVELSAAYGQPDVRTMELEADEYLFATRLYRTQDRRGEVVLAIERPGRRVLLHRKGWYEHDVYRLLSGGIGLEERVETSLIRELQEETGLTPLAVDFLAVLDCPMSYRSETISFVSYVFHLRRTEGTLRLPQTEEISDFREVPISQLHQVADALRKVPPPRTGWGHWRAIAHDVVYEMLAESQASNHPLSASRPPRPGTGR